MKQYLNSEQTAKLIELGLEKPSPKWVKDENGDYRVKTNDADYDIGELLSFLPTRIYIGSIYIDYNGLWRVGYENTVLHQSEFELIDALYFMCVKLKEEGVI